MLGRSTTDAIFALRRLMERHKEMQVNLHTVFIDLEKAYDQRDCKDLLGKKLASLSQNHMEEKSSDMFLNGAGTSRERFDPAMVNCYLNENALRVPRTRIPTPGANSIWTPAAMVSVCPGITVISLLMMYGFLRGNKVKEEGSLPPSSSPDSNPPGPEGSHWRDVEPSTKGSRRIILKLASAAEEQELATTNELNNFHSISQLAHELHLVIGGNINLTPGWSVRRPPGLIFISFSTKYSPAVKACTPSTSPPTLPEPGIEKRGTYIL
ncbi:hypothetical protein J437_LFUL014052 [Ladona fulva]|uniref:Reverse transcriptase domain-containing protein n=1 Tax=Ladona fulva TaxID=123851 RepID=A0A8K0P8S7_LADFU|nr:hypothetical protein J437_LFUL014052 [Ladona fulva]